ncbi:MAG: hypothetical protein KIH08_12180 [Candidatus Freyarchaeota archaeon]|nr:hypothetical protein [Candidatus Jordarchaeia archaeon]
MKFCPKCNSIMLPTKTDDGTVKLKRVITTSTFLLDITLIV